MKPHRSNRFLAFALTSLVTLSSSVFAADRIKQNNTTALNLAGSWDTLPGSSDVAVWDSTVLAANASALGGNLSWQGLRLASPGGAVTIGTSGETGTLTLGNAGIDMSTATQNLTINNSIIASGAQTWNVKGGQTLNLWAVNTGRGLSGSGNISLASTGAGTATFNMQPGANTSTGFSDVGGNASYTGNWTIGAGVNAINIRNGATAWGTGSIILSGGQISSTGGNWTWTNAVTLTTSTTSSLQMASGNDRSLKVQGVISGSGGLTILSQGGTQGHADRGVILTGANTMSGTVTINSGAFLRVGGIAGNDTTLGAGTSGTLGDGSVTNNVVNNGTLTFSRSNAHTAGNNISGSGVVYVGGTTGVAASIWGTVNDIAAASTQVVTLSGTNTYTGATQVNAGRLNLTGSLTSAISVAAGAGISGTGTTTDSLTTASGAGIVLAGGAATTGLTVNGATFNGATQVTFDATPIASTVYDVLTYGLGTVTNPGNLTVAWRGVLSNDVANKKYIFTAGAAATRTWNTTDGTWDQGATANWAEGDNLFYSGDTVIFNNPASASVVTLAGAIAPASVSVTNTNAYTFAGAAIAGGTGLTKSGSGILTLSVANTFTGNVAVNGGTLKVGNASSLGTHQVGNPVTQIVIGSGGALELNGIASIYGYTLSGTGVGGTGALVNTGAAIGNGLAQVSNLKLGADASIGGSGNWSLLTTSYAATSLDLNAFTLTKTGANTIALVNTTTTAGTVHVAGGTLALGVSENANGVTGGASSFTLDDTAGAALSVVRSSSVGSLAGGGAAGGNVVLGATLTVGALNTPTIYAGVLSGTGGALTKIGTSSLTLANANTYTGLTTVNAGTLAVTASTSLGSGLANASGETSAIMDFGANTVTLGNATAGNTGAFFYGKLVGTGTLRLRGGTQTIHNADGTGSTSTNYQIFSPVTAAMPVGAFALDTGSSVTDRKDFGFTNDTDDVLTLSSLTGYGAIRCDAGGVAPVTRHITVAQSSGDTVFNGALLSHKHTGGSVRALAFEKTGSSALELAGFIGKQTAPSAAGAAPVNLTANGGVLSVTNAANTTTANTDAISLGTVTVTSGTLAFSAQALINTAGNAGATSIAMNGGTLMWNAANTQDITAGNRLTLVSGKTATFNTNGNDVTLSNALGGGAIAAAVTKEGSGKLTLGGSNTYTGDTTVNGGTLAVNGTSIDDANKLVINGGKVDPTGTTETVGTLYFGAAQQAAGTWGSTTSGATHQDDVHFSGTGVVLVSSGPSSGYLAWIGGFSLGGQTGINQDPDNDGIANGLEFLLKGGNPEVPNSTQLPVGTSSGTNLIFTFERDDRAKGASSGVTVTVEAGTNLTTWPDVYSVGADTASSTSGVVITNDADANPDTVTVTIPKSGASAKFARIKVVGTP